MRGNHKGLRRWELALLCGVATAFLMGVWLSGQQSALAGELIRLHVIGASDSVEDQAVKLRVRDAVLAEAEPYLEGVTTLEEARAVLSGHLEELARAGVSAAEGAAVTASLEDNVWFPTKEYTDFALPAGRYTALRIVVGEGSGQNWWCVVFPPLCMGAVSEVTKEAGSFTDGQLRLITGESEGYVVKFRLLEWWNELSRRFGG